MRLVEFILGVVISHIFVLEETLPYGSVIDMKVIIACLLPASWMYIIYMYIVMKKGISFSFHTIHRGLIPVAVMICVESFLVFIVLPLMAIIIKPIAILLYYLWVCRITLLLTIPVSYKIIKVINNRLLK